MSQIFANPSNKGTVNESSRISTWFHFQASLVLETSLTFSTYQMLHVVIIISTLLGIHIKETTTMMLHVKPNWLGDL